MGKNDPFKNKPTPPKKEHVLADLANADESDIVFTTSYPAPELVPASKDSTQKNIQSDETAGAESHPDPAVVNFTYEQVARIQELHSQLLEEPNVLQEKYKYLEKLGQDVSQSIAELKEAADTVLNKATK